MTNPLAGGEPQSPADAYDALWDLTPDAPPDLASFLAAHPEGDARDRLDVLLVDQARRWWADRPRLAEVYLQDHPDLAADPVAKLDLVYGEIRARERLGDPISPSAMARRFPDLRDELTRQAEVGRWMDGAATEPPTRLGDGPPSISDPDAPLRASDFRMEKELGSGGMGTVYLAEQRSLGKWVAMKVLNRGLGASDEAVRRFLAEGRAVARLRHPYIVGVHGVGRLADGGYFLIMDLIDGPDLASTLKDGPLPIDVAVNLAAQVAEALDHAHGRGVIHRDLKPSNVLLDVDGRAMVTDFGLSKQFGGDEPALSRSDQILGTPHYMAPEQVDSLWGQIGPQTDVYGLGALLYALLAGRAPVGGRSTFEILSRVAAPDPLPSVRTARPDVPEALDLICERCLKKSPRLRFNSAREVAEALRSLPMRTSRAGPAEMKKPGPIENDWEEITVTVRWRIGKVAAAAAVLLLAIALAIGMTLGWMRGVSVGVAIHPPSRSRTEPPNSPPIAALPAESGEFEWKVKRGRAGKWVALTEHPGPITTGDRLRIECRLNAPSFPFLYWIRGDGEVRQLYPESIDSKETTTLVRVPEGESSDGILVKGSAGIDYFILIVAERESDRRSASRWEQELAIFKPLAALEEDTILLDGRPFKIRSASEGEVKGRQESPPHEAASRALKGLPKRLMPANLGVSTLALPHVEPPESDLPAGAGGH